MRSLRPILFGIALVLASNTTGAAKEYVFTEPDGTVRFTNAPVESKRQPLRLASRSWPKTSWQPIKIGSTGGVRRIRYDEIIKEAATRHSVDSNLIKAVIRVESDFKPLAVSPKGALGLMQLMPSTARELQVRRVFDPASNVNGGTKHLRYLMDRFDGNLRLVLAAYNAGEGAVRKYGGIPPYRETQDYVRKVLRYRTAYVRGG